MLRRTRCVQSYPYREHISWLWGFPATASFVAGGTSECFSFSPIDIPEIVQTAGESMGNTPNVAGYGDGTRLALEIAKLAQEARAARVRFGTCHRVLHCSMRRRGRAPLSKPLSDLAEDEVGVLPNLIIRAGKLRG
jgi:hypothetical protein